MSISESRISEAIIGRYFKKLSDNLNVDVAIAGAGPSGLLAARDLAARGYKVALFEKKLSLGGGLWGGGMLFNEIVVDEEGRTILEDLGVQSRRFDEFTYTACSIETTSALVYQARKAGATIFNTIGVEDVIIRNGRISGYVVNWAPVETSGLHVDPLSFEAKVCLEATGHSLEVVQVLCRKNDIKLHTKTGGIMGEQSMEVQSAEELVVENTAECFPGLYVCGMAASACFGAPRMGPIFGGMLKSGKKVAQLIAGELEAK